MGVNVSEGTDVEGMLDGLNVLRGIMLVQLFEGIFVKGADVG